MTATKTDSSAECVVVVGVGLIGGSIGLAARRSGRYGQIIGVGRDWSSLERAKQLGCIDEITTDLAAAAPRADVLVMCTPVDRIADQTLATLPKCKPSALVTDAGSTKAAIVARIETEWAGQALFVGSHPLAGSEKKGPEHAKADLFDGRLTLITPTARTPKAAIERATAFWESLGSRVKPLSPVEHDESMAFTSHLPHLVSAILAGVLPPKLAELTATGFRDTTRLAGGDPQLWTAIFQQNSRNVAAALDSFLERSNRFRTALLMRDAAGIQELLSEAKKVRDDLGS